MESLPRKRKGTKISPLIGLLHHSDGGDHGRRSKKKCRGPEKAEPCTPGTPAGVVMTTPPVGRPSCDSPSPGLKRKLGCIEPSTRIGRKKQLEQEYAKGREIGKGKFGSVRICRSLASGEEYACTCLPKAGDETARRPTRRSRSCSTSRATRAW